MKSLRLILSFAALVLFSHDLAVRAQDCNGNGIADDVDVRPQNFGFADAVSLDTPGRSVVAIDIDGDGDFDLATADERSRNRPGLVTVLRNNGRGEIEDRMEYFVGAYPTSLAAADFDGDGSGDLVTANLYSDDVSLLHNSGDGTFRDPVSLQVDPLPQFVIAADLDGDGDADLATAHPSRVLVILNQGGGRFELGDRVSVPDDAVGLAAADLDGDGRLDLAVAVANRQSAPSPTGTVLVALNEGNGSFSTVTEIPFDHMAFALTAVDVDGDRDVDLVVATPPSSRLSVLLNDGAATFELGGTYDTIGRATPVSVTAADFDGDGDLDLATANHRLTRDLSPNWASVLLNNGDGTYQEALNLVTRQISLSVAAADLDGDSVPDLAVVGHGNGTLFLNVTTPPVSPDLNGNGVPDDCEQSFQRGDANADGTIDIADAVAVFEWLFRGADPPACLDAADTDNTGRHVLTDGIYLLAWLFQGGAAPPAPGPRDCGVDPEGGDTGCRSYPPCL